MANSSAAFSASASRGDLDRSLQGFGSNQLDFLVPEPKECPLGFICSAFTDDVYPCKLVQDKAYTLFDFGGIHSGMYCPENKTTFVNCPVGHYCPDPSTKLPCPSGYFCPYKTAVPEMICKDCPEQSTRMARAKWGDDLMIALACFVIILYFAFLWSHWYGKRKARLKTMEERFLSADREKAIKQRERARLARIRPRLEEIAERIEAEIQKQKCNSSNPRRFSDFSLEEVDDDDSGDDAPKHKSGVKFDVESSEGNGKESGAEDTPNKEYGIHSRRKFMGFDLDGNIWFDADILFDTLDADGSEDLSYEELNTFMQLGGVELVHFITTMNELGGIYVDDEDESTMNSLLVPRHIFTEHFLEALEVASNFSCTKQEAEVLFDEICAAKAKAKNATIENGNSRRRSGSVPNLVSRRGSRKVNVLYISDLFDSKCAGFMSEAQLNALAKKIRDAKSKKGGSMHDIAITREEFATFYPKMLEDATRRDHRLKDFREKSNFGEGFDLSFTRLCLSVKVGGKNVNVVNNLTGRLQAKTMTAVMGGKSV